MTEQERIIKAKRQGNHMVGPVERVRCSVHPTRWESYRWVWPAPTEGETQEDAITDA